MILIINIINIIIFIIIIIIIISIIFICIIRLMVLFCSFLMNVTIFLFNLHYNYSFNSFNKNMCLPLDFLKKTPKYICISLIITGLLLIFYGHDSYETNGELV